MKIVEQSFEQSNLYPLFVYVMFTSYKRLRFEKSFFDYRQ